MKILAISGGSKNGNNDAMAKEALMGAQEMGAEIEFVHLLDLNIKPCTGCIACVKSLMQGGLGDCAIKDDYQWLYNKILDADGVIIAMPIYEKGTPGVFRTLQDRMCGPANDTGTNFIAKKIAEEQGKAGPDPRKFAKKYVSYISIGGSDWFTSMACDMAMTAMSPMWNVVQNEIFSWSKCIVVNDESVEKCHQIGVNLAKTIADPDNYKYLSEPGICPICHCRNFYIHSDNSTAECEVCGMQGKLEIHDGKLSFSFPQEKLALAHTTLSGKMKHMDDMYGVETALMEAEQTDKFKERKKKYREFIQGSKP
jgi:multimeric flavodoxin WrbA